MHGCSCADRKVWITYFFAFYSFFRLLLFFPPFTLFSAFPPFTPFPAFYPFFRFSAFYPFFRFSAFPSFTLFSAFPLFRFLPFFPLFRFRFSVFPFPRFTLTRFPYLYFQFAVCYFSLQRTQMFIAQCVYIVISSAGVISIFGLICIKCAPMFPLSKENFVPKYTSKMSLIFNVYFYYAGFVILMNPTRHYSTTPI